MAEENILINSGTGPAVAVDLVGTNNYQIVKVVQAPSGSTGTLSGVFAVTNTGVATVAVSGTASVTVANSPTVTSVSSPYATVVAGRVTVTSAGAAIALSSSLAIKGVRLVGLPTNTGTVRWGGSAVVSSSGSQSGMALYADQQTDMIPISDLSSLYIVGPTSGEGVAYVYFA